MINNNPETISTDYNLADRLYFEPIEAKIIKEIYEFEKVDGVLIQFGGQAAINISHELESFGVKILGTSNKSLDISEDRQKFNDFLSKLDIKQPKSIQCFAKNAAIEAKTLNFPVIVRPSYVIGGSGMIIANDLNEVSEYLKNHDENSIIFIDEFVQGEEFEIDSVSSGDKIFIPLIAEHVEKSGIHSGDSQVLYPCQNLKKELQEKIIEISEKIIKNLEVIGLANIQFVVKNDEIFVIEANLRSSRTIPIINKVCEINMIELAISAILKNDFEVPKFDIKKAIKKPIFSNYKISSKEIPLGVEMRSTGEILEFLR